MTFAHTGASYARGFSRAYRKRLSRSDCSDSMTIPAQIGMCNYLGGNMIWERRLRVILRVTGRPLGLLWLPPCCRRARFKRSNSVTASVQADLDPEGFPGLSIAVPTQDKSLQFGCSFQRHSSEPESASQYTECHRTVHTQGQWAYREVSVRRCAKNWSPESSFIREDGVLLNYILCFRWKSASFPEKICFSKKFVCRGTCIVGGNQL